MTIEQTQKIIDGAVADFIDTCPHCGAKVHMKMIFNDKHIKNNRDVIYYVVFRCVPCKKLILETCRFEQNYYDQNENLKFIGWNDKYPNDGTAFIEKYENAVPKDVLDDFEEGAKSIKNGCLKAGVSMFRRSLQSALINLGADESLELVDQIKNQSGLTQDIKDWAHNIRILGNWGAHPQTDNLKDIDLKLAEETQSFLEQFFNYVYLMPSMVANARQRNKKQETEKLKEEES